MYCVNQAVNYSVNECQAILEESASRCASVKLTPNYDTEFWDKVSVGTFEVRFTQENNF